MIYQPRASFYTRLLSILTYKKLVYFSYWSWWFSFSLESTYIPLFIWCANTCGLEQTLTPDFQEGRCEMELLTLTQGILSSLSKSLLQSFNQWYAIRWARLSDLHWYLYLNERRSFCCSATSILNIFNNPTALGVWLLGISIKNVVSVLYICCHIELKKWITDDLSNHSSVYCLIYKFIK